MTEQNSMHWEANHTLGYEPMDQIHDEFLGLLAQLQGATNEQLSERLRLMDEHLQNHFEKEDTWMKQTEFPPRRCHMDEHAAVLKSIAEVRALLEQGNFQICRSLTDALEEWFAMHTTHLDSALAHWMGRNRLKGKPMVFKPMKRA